MGDECLSFKLMWLIVEVGVEVKGGLGDWYELYQGWYLVLDSWIG